MKQADRKQLFLDICYGRASITVQEASKHGFLISRQCRFCSEQVDETDAVITSTYWKACFALSHKKCQTAGYATEAYECQVIDADCNDCVHFKRGKRIILNGDKNKKTGVHKLIATDSFHGECLKFFKPTIANVNFASGHPCFEHRKKEKIYQ